MGGSDSESDEEDQEEKPSGKKAEKKSGVYVPPKLAPMHYGKTASHTKCIDMSRQKICN